MRGLMGKAGAFMVLVFLLSWPLSLGAQFEGFSPLLVTLAFLPAAIALGLRLFAEGRNFQDLYLHPGRWWYYPASFVGMLAVLAIPKLAGWAIDENFWTRLPSLLWRMSDLRFMGSLALASVGLGALAIGEELGWRGYLLPRLLGLGERGAILLTSLAWVLWYLPLVFRSQVFGETTGPRVIFLVHAFFLGCVLGWAFVKSRSLPLVMWLRGIASAALYLVYLKPAGRIPFWPRSWGEIVALWGLPLFALWALARCQGREPGKNPQSATAT